MISERTKLPLGFVLTLVAAAVGLASAAAVAQYRVGAATDRLDRVEVQSNTHEVRLGRTDVLLEQMGHTLDRIDRNVEHLKREH